MTWQNPLRSLLAGVALVGLGASCTTTYDAYGRPRSSVDPGLAVAGAAAAGVLGYAIANNNNDDDRHHRRSRGRSRYNHHGHDYHNHHGYHRDHYSSRRGGRYHRY